MKFTCTCGYLIHDHTDGQSAKARLIPDQDWNPFWDHADQLIADLAAGKIDQDAVAMELRKRLRGASRQAWQCPSCGRIHIDARQPQLHSFTPDSAAAPKTLFQTGDKD